MKKNTIKGIKEIFGSKFLRLVEINYEDSFRNDKKWYMVTRKGIDEYKDVIEKRKNDSDDAVVICATTENKEKIVLIKEFRMPINDYIYSLPAGIVEKGEDIYDSAVREMREETGLSLVIDREKSRSLLYPSVGLSDESLSMIYGSVSGEISEDMLEESEIIETIIMDTEDVKKLLDRDAKIDLKAWYFIKEFLNGTL